MSNIQRLGDSKRFSAAAIHNDVVYLSGQISWLEDSNITDQTRDIFAKVDALLAEAGTRKSRVISAQIWLKDVADYEGMNAVWDEWVDAENPPVRVCVQSLLARPVFLVEVLIVAAV